MRAKFKPISFSTLTPQQLSLIAEIGKIVRNHAVFVDEDIFDFHQKFEIEREQPVEDFCALMDFNIEIDTPRYRASSKLITTLQWSRDPYPYIIRITIAKNLVPLFILLADITEPEEMNRIANEWLFRKFQPKTKQELLSDAIAAQGFKIRALGSEPDFGFYQNAKPGWYCDLEEDTKLYSEIFLGRNFSQAIDFLHKPYSIRKAIITRTSGVHL